MISFFKYDFAPLLLNRKRMNSIYLCEYFYLGSNKEVEKCELTIFHSWTNNCHKCWDSMFWRNWRYFFYIFWLTHTLYKQQCVFFVSFYPHRSFENCTSYFSYSIHKRIICLNSCYCVIWYFLHCRFVVKW